MKTVTSISGGETSAYLAANYPTDYNVFALVRIEDQRCLFPDKTLRQQVEDRIQAPFIATAEDDMIIYTIFDLEQYLGKRIDWVTGITFDEVVRSKGGWLPNKLHRYCTSNLKMLSIFYWWKETIGEPCEMSIGYRSNEMRRAAKMQENLNSEGLSEVKYPEMQENGRNKWHTVAWRKPVFPLIEDGIFKSGIKKYWQDKNVRFAEKNNCIGCFHRNPLLLKKMQQLHPQKFQWFADQEGGKNGYWRSDTSYSKIQQYQPQYEIDFEEFSDCDSGYCGL